MMYKLALLFIMILVFTVWGGVLLVKGPSGNYTAAVINGTLVVDGQSIPLPQKVSWYFNGSYTVYGIYYGNPQCLLSLWPDRPEFYITCTVGTDIAIVVLKDPKAKIICRDKNNILTPTTATQHLEMYRTRSLYVECKSNFSATVSTPSLLIAVMAGATAASMSLFVALSVLLLRRALKEEH
ncbi:conserved hypothetical protein [Pyrobaculum islandicum DSM 4184]|uniref:Uncharacterized protein n=1 Tax=Pyrobaculum islandicum (strain DSM 4184 / JCM 9189 / GEO3) TaxID=384616 RepID=A1RS63_PYRIL|nr:hypothetical protein [Pyrobaculum islandicum]ABL87795.1 conserved hypothetical protein [Pyrobaculum islandicum DSM 4184]